MVDSIREQIRIREEHMGNIDKQHIKDAEPYKEKIKKELRELYIDQEAKNYIYESTEDTWRAYGRGRKAGGLKRSYDVAYRKFSNKLKELGWDLVAVGEPNDEMFHIVTQYLRITTKEDVKKRVRKLGHEYNKRDE